MRLCWAVVSAIALCLLPCSASLAVPAFPGAEGSGAVSVGGRGGQVIEVTNLNDSGSGSLRAALEASGARIVVFRVGGTIALDSTIEVYNPYLTIAGQTAPGDGICVKASASMPTDQSALIVSATHDTIVRYMRFRLGRVFGDQRGSGMNHYAWSTHIPYNVMIDHCSVSWSSDENITFWGDSGVDNPHDLTVQRSIVSEGLYGHAAGFISGGGECETMTDIDVHHNLFAHNSNRMPLLKNENGRVVNNIVYNWEWYGSGFEGGVIADIVGNYYKRGPNDDDQYEIKWQTTWTSCPDTGPSGNPSVYIVGNKGPHNSDPQADNWPMIGAGPYWDVTGPLSTNYKRTSPQTAPTYPITVDSVLNIDTVLLNDVGCSRRLDANGDWVSIRDAVDSRIVTEYQNGTGMIPGLPSDVGGYPTYNNGTPYTDSDHDGMSDTWENAKFGSLSRNGTGDYDSDGYTDLEEFLNGTNPGGGSNPPVANFTGNPTSGTAPLTVNFTDTSTNSPTSWSWTFGDGGTSTAQNPSHQYTVSLTATNAYGSDGETKTNYITVNPPAPVANFSGTPTSGNAPLTVNFTDSSTNSPTSWSWTFGDGGTSTAQNPSHQYTTANAYTVTLTATNAGGSDGETKTNYITVTGGGGSVPTFVASGAVAYGTGTITPALPSGIQSNDILLLFLETANQVISISNQNGGTWTAVTNSPQGTGTEAAADATRLTAFWSRYNGSQGAPTVSDSGNHQIGRIIAVRGAETSGNPWDVTAGGVEATADTSGSIPGATTTVANTLVVAAIATALPDANGTANFSAWANGNLANVTEQTDNTRGAGNGGGLAIATGEKATAGAYGNTTVTCATAAKKGMMSIALKPPSAPPVTIYSDDFESGLGDWNLTGTPDWYSGSPKIGSYSVQFRGPDERITQFGGLVSTQGYVDVTVSFYMGANSLDSSSEYMLCCWKDGTTWYDLKRINDGDAEEDNQLHYFSFEMPAGADDNPNFAFEFKLVGSATDDYGYADNIVITGTPK